MDAVGEEEATVEKAEEERRPRKRRLRTMRSKLLPLVWTMAAYLKIRIELTAPYLHFQLRIERHW